MALSPGAKPYPSKMQRMLKEDRTLFMQSLFGEYTAQKQANERN